VAAAPGVPIDDLLGIDGPMARSVDDVALLLDAMSGEDIRNPVSLPKPAVSFTDAAASGWVPPRVAFSADLGITPVDPEVEDICRTAATRFEELGASVDEDHPDLSEAHDTFQVLRARGFSINLGPLYSRSPELLKPEVRWNIERGLALTVADLDRAERQRAAMYARTVDFFDRYDLLLTPATIVAAYPVEQRYLGACNGHTFDTYIDWLAIAYAITLVACPTLSLPCGFTREGLPIGLQIVAAPRADDRVLAAARALEGVLGVAGSTPIDPRPSTLREV
jgi:amidase